MRAINKHIKVPDSIRKDFESWVESFGWCIERNGDGDYVTMSTDAAWGGWCASHKQYMAQPAQEPVGSLSVRYFRGAKSMTNTDFDYTGDLPQGDYKLYTTPQQERKPLTDKQIDAICPQGWAHRGALKEMARAIEAAHGIGSKT